MKVKGLMTRDVECIAPDASLREAAQWMRQIDAGVLPVCDNDRLAGMITDRDIVVRCIADGANPDQCTVREAMTPELFYCFEEDDVGDAARTMREHQVRRLVVLNDEKRLAGIISLGDLAVETGDDRLSGNTLEAVSQHTGMSHT